MDGVLPIAILQVRGYYNHESDSEESWPGACQLTVHGEIMTEKEDIVNGVLRETKEELGEIAYFLVNSYLQQYMGPKMILMSDDTRDKKRNISYWLHYKNPDMLKAIGYGPASGRIKIVELFELRKIKNLLLFSKKKGVPPNIIAMFTDELKVLKTAMKKIKDDF